MMKAVIILLVALFATVSQAFVAPNHPYQTSSFRRTTSSLAMSDEPMLGETERMLLEHKERQDSGLVQEYGRTVKNDGLDNLRAFIWAVFDVSNVVFPVLGVALSLGLFLNMAGYGYYFEDGGLVIDSLKSIQQEQAFQEEMTKLAVDAVNKVGML